MTEVGNLSIHTAKFLNDLYVYEWRYEYEFYRVGPRTIKRI